MTSGGCEILHADCIEVLQTLAENSFDALITDKTADRAHLEAIREQGVEINVLK